jgi:hypothetical protein
LNVGTEKVAKIGHLGSIRIAVALEGLQVFKSEWHNRHNEVGTAMFLKEEVLLVRLRRCVPNKVDFEWQALPLWELHIPRTVVTMEHEETLMSSALSVVDWCTGSENSTSVNA